MLVLSFSQPPTKPPNWDSLAFIPAECCSHSWISSVYRPWKFYCFFSQENLNLISSWFPLDWIAYEHTSGTLRNYNLNSQNLILSYSIKVVTDNQIVTMQCNHQTNTKETLLRHQRAVHEGLKHPCRQCNHQATSKGNLARHKRAVHEGVKFSCRQCTYQATQKGNLVRHRRAVHDPYSTIAVNVTNNFFGRLVKLNSKVRTITNRI